MSARPNSQRVVLTGMGCVTPLGDDVSTVWDRMLRGESGVRAISRFNARAFTTNFAAESADPDLASLLYAASDHEGAGLNSRFALAAASRAWRQAGLGDPSQKDGADPRRAGLDPRRLGVYLGSGEGSLDTENFVAANIAGWDEDARRVDMQAWTRAAQTLMTPQRELEQEPNMALSHLANAFGARGPAYNCLTACAASTQAIGEACEILRRGDADAMLAGGAHSMIHPLGVTGFIRLTALSNRSDAPTSASRPFDRTRNGFVMGEGAGVVVLETLANARKRGATPLAEIVGYGSSADAFRITDIQPDGEGAQAAMREALTEAGIDPLAKDASGRPLVHYVSAHGTGTQENDAIETRAVRAVFADNAPDIPMSSIKSMLGHLIAAAGVVELIACVKAIETGVLPPTMNLHEPDPACDLDYVPNAARDLRERGGVSICLSNSFGFGGQNDTLIVQRVA